MSHLANKTFGVELEFTVPYEYSGAAVAAAMEAAGIACSYAGYSHRLTSYWKVVTDASVSGGAGYSGLEIVSPILTGADGFAQIEKVCAVLATLNARVNTSCGLHVHVGARDMSINAMKALAKIYAECEDVIDSVMPNSRRGRNNSYCQPVKGVRWEALAAATSAGDIATAINGGGRYCKLNYAAHRKHGTVEFRHHAGTVDAAKVTNWVHACLRMVATAQKEATDIIAVTVNRPVINNARLRKIYEMVCRDQGASREEIAAMLQRRTAPPVAKILTNAALPFQVRRGRYYATLTATPVPLPGRIVVNNLQDFATRMEMPAAELNFPGWQAYRSKCTAGGGGISRRPTTQTRIETMLYMAYGSNMNRDQMQRRCPGATFIKKMVLKDHRLVFRFHADVEFCEGTDCDVLLWEINAAHEHDLDMFEGVGTGHYRKEYAELENGAKALIYIMNETGVTPPSRAYYATIKAGYEFYKINLKPLRNALLHAWVGRKDTDYTAGRARRVELQTHKGFKPKKTKGKGKKAKATLPEDTRPVQQRQRPNAQMNFNDWLADRKASGRSY